MRTVPVLQPDVDALRRLPVDELLAEAGRARDRAHGRRIGWSPRVVIPLARRCHETCGHNGCSDPPALADAPYREPEALLAAARWGVELGCHEALFTVPGPTEAPGPGAREWLAAHGCASVGEYLVAMCHLVLDETGLLPRAWSHGGVPEMPALRSVTPSQAGLVDPGHLAAVEAAGQLRIPFSVVVQARSSADYLGLLLAVADAHGRHGHVQDVVLRRPERPVDGDGNGWLAAVALARLLLPEEVHLQVAPDPGDDPGVLLDAGVDDWGGLAPPTEGEVSREGAWPPLGRWQRAAEARGFVLTPRLAVQPRYARRAEVWLDPRLHFAVLDRSDAEGLARDDPGAVLPHRFVHRPQPGAGEVALIGPRSTAWFAGAGGRPPVLVPAPGSVDGPIREVLDGVGMGQEPGEEELAVLFTARGREVAAVCELADELRRAAAGEAVTYVRSRRIDCTPARRRRSLPPWGRHQLPLLEEVVELVVDAHQRGATEVRLEAGIRPELKGEYYLQLVQAVKAAAPAMHVHGLTAAEIADGARQVEEPLDSYLRRLAGAGLTSLAGAGAAILDDEVRVAAGGAELTSAEWLEVHRTAHRVGVRSSLSMTFGTVERLRHWARHLVRTRALQRETGGFIEFAPDPFVHMTAPLYRERRARRGPTFREVLLVHAVGRITYQGLIDNMRVPWLEVGPAGAAQALQAGGNDLGGALEGEGPFDEDDFRALTESLGRPLAERTTLYALI